MATQNGNYEKLVEQITDMVLAKLGGDDYCPTFCSADVQRIVDAGAGRISPGAARENLRVAWNFGTGPPAGRAAGTADARTGFGFGLAG